jgi:hypothetical protein
MNKKQNPKKEEPFMNRIQSYFLTLFLVIILSVPLYTLFRGEPAPEESVVEARAMVALRPRETPNLQRALNHLEKGEVFQAVNLIFDLFTAASFLETVERATSDQFPMRMPIIQFSKAIERGIINIAYAFVNDTVIPADMTNNIYVDKEHNQLIFSPTSFDEDIRRLVHDRINNFNDLIGLFPDQHFYVYYHQTLRNSEFHPLNKYFSDANSGQAIRYFEENLPEGLIFDKFLLNSMQDHLHYYFRTDHHWNVYGVLRAYEEIYRMLSLTYPKMSPMLENEEIVYFPEIEFLGNLARITFFPIEGDEFAVEVVDFPPHTVIYGGQELTTSLRDVYFEGNYSTIPYINHFNEFYGRVTDLVHYSFDNDSDRNLLIIGSSYRYALDPLIGSHYKNTYAVDLRYYPTFRLSEFIENHPVDDILLVGTNQVLFQDFKLWEIKP